MSDAADDVKMAVWQGITTGHFDSTRLPPMPSFEDGERVQLATLERRIASGEQLGGWKVGLTSGAARDSFGPGIRPFGHLLKSRIFPTGSEIDLKRIAKPGIETEMCFRVGRRISGKDVSVDTVRAGIAAVMPAFEINEDRIEGPQDQGLRVADNLRQWGVVIGREAPLSESTWNTVVSTLSHDGKLLESVSARGHIDNHFASIQSLVRELAKFDQALSARKPPVRQRRLRCNERGRDKQQRR